MSMSQNRRGPGRAALQRKTTRGPLDAEDPLNSSPLPSPSSGEPIASPLAASIEIQRPPSNPLLVIDDASRNESPIPPSDGSKDLSFVLDTSIYHPLTNIDTPPPFRHPLPPPPNPNTSLDRIFTDLSGLLTQCHFLSAAHLAALTLTSGIVKPTDATSVFHLLSIRYSALELAGNVLLAAQESKALEDLSSSFYYLEISHSMDVPSASDTEQPAPTHIMPFALRLQALRLQGIGFGDSRRTVGALFDLGMECRENVRKCDSETRVLWQERLQEVGIRVVNTLIEMGDLDCAKRTLISIDTDKQKSDAAATARIVLLLIKMGEIQEAQALLKTMEDGIATASLLQAFIEIADGEYELAVNSLSQVVDTSDDQAIAVIAKQNLAVVHLYTGNIEKSRQILKSLVNEGYSFQALTVNLATLYDLTSDRSKELKTNLAAQVAKSESNRPQRGFVNADFKL